MIFNDVLTEEVMQYFLDVV